MQKVAATVAAAAALASCSNVDDKQERSHVRFVRSLAAIATSLYLTHLLAHRCLACADGRRLHAPLQLLLRSAGS